MQRLPSTPSTHGFALAVSSKRWQKPMIWVGFCLARTLCLQPPLYFESFGTAIGRPAPSMSSYNISTTPPVCPIVHSRGWWRDTKEGSGAPNQLPRGSWSRNIPTFTFRGTHRPRGVRSVICWNTAQLLEDRISITFPLHYRSQGPFLGECLKLKLCSSSIHI